MTSAPQEVTTEPSSPEASGPQRLRDWLVRTLMFGVKLAVGMWLCQFFLGSILVLGWVFRLMKRSALKAWWKQGPHCADARSFRAFAQRVPALHPYSSWPNWLLRQRGAVGSQRHAVARGLTFLLGSLWENLRAGLSAILSTWSLTLPGCVLWLFAWYAGWNNSFHKGYEQAEIGPLTGLLGTGLFIAAMVYVPLAQARQAMTGSPWTFFNFGLNVRLISLSWWGTLCLAVWFTLIAFPVNILFVAPTFFPQINPALEEATDAEILRMITTYYLVAAAPVLLAVVTLKTAAARLYARAILKGLRSGRIETSALHAEEQAMLQHLELAVARPPRRRHLIVRATLGAGRWFRTATVLFAISLIWFTFVAQIFVVEFFHYRPIDFRGNFLGGWMNRPLVQLPWCDYTPGALRQRVRTGHDPGLSVDWEPRID